MSRKSFPNYRISTFKGRKGDLMLRIDIPRSKPIYINLSRLMPRTEGKARKEQCITRVIGYLDTAMEHFNSNLDIVAQGLIKRMRNMENRLNEVERRLDEMESALDSRIAELERSINEVAEMVDALRKTIRDAIREYVEEYEKDSMIILEKAIKAHMEGKFTK